jgi:hypothetical protein
VHAMDKVDENLVVERLVAANVPLKHHPDPFDELEPILDLQLPTVPLHIPSPIHGRKPCCRGQQPPRIPPELWGIEIRLESIDGELLGCPGNEGGTGISPML